MPRWKGRKPLNSAIDEQIEILKAEAVHMKALKAEAEKSYEELKALTARLDQLDQPPSPEDREAAARDLQRLLKELADG